MSMVPVTVVEKMDTISSAKELSNRKRVSFLVMRKVWDSLFLGLKSCRVSANVAKTAPATKAAGAPRLEHHPKALSIISGLLGPSPPRSLRARIVVLEVE